MTCSCSNPRGIFTVIYDPETGLLFAPGNDVLVCDVPINELETDTEQIDYIQKNGIPLKDVITVGWLLSASPDVVCPTLDEATDHSKLIPNERETDGSN